MNLKLTVAIALLAAIPLCAQAQQGGKKATKADAQKVVTLISADKAKMQAYCDMAKLGDQMDQAEKKKDNKQAEALSKKMDELGPKIGPEYASLMDGLQDVDPNSKDGKDIGATLEALDKNCAK